MKENERKQTIKLYIEKKNKTQNYTENESR